MSTIVLFHSALGRTPAVEAFARGLRGHHHEVITPDLFDGETFTTLDDGVKKRDALGIPELMRRAAAAVEGLPADCIYAGFSMGAAAAQFLALTRPGARGCVLMHAVLPLAAMGANEWPTVPLQVHTSERDPWVDQAIAEAVVRGAGGELVRYPGAAHLFADERDPGFDAQHAARLLERVAAFVDER